MDGIDRLRLLTAQMHLEPVEDAQCPQLSRRKKDSIALSQAMLPGGKKITLLKTQLTSFCERNCYYCPFRSGRDFRRATFTPDEFAKTYLALYHARITEGVFLSSGIINNSIFSQDKLLETAEILRLKYGYRGYLHLKLMPGAQRMQVERAMQLADRVSLNLEAPNAQSLNKLAPSKLFIEELMQPLRWVHNIRQSLPATRGWNGHWPSATTQFVVGAIGESDLDLLKTTQYLYHNLSIKRAYFSAFNPIMDTPFENLPATQPLREARLYEASFLIRDYGFDLEELPFDNSGNMPIDIDPKLAWARANIASQPIEINRASYHELLRVPGIGLKGARIILNIRKTNSLRNLETLTKLGINARKAAPFILLDGHKPAYQSRFL